MSLWCLSVLKREEPKLSKAKSYLVKVICNTRVTMLSSNSTGNNNENKRLLAL